MKKYILPLAIIALLIFGCNPATNFVARYFNTGNLTEQEFIITTDKDTTIKTADGIIINIPAYSIKTDGNKITLHIKEALSMAEILKAGLTTQAGKDILSSDGMFYIGTKEQSTITSALHIKLPTANADKNMQLYKGVEGDGKIDWQNPTPIAKTITPLADSGEVLFNANCTSCHGIDKQLTGPALAGMDIRRSRKWNHAFIKNNFRLLDCGDEYALALYHKYGSAMTVFEGSLSDRQIDAIIRYVDKASNNTVQPENPNDYLDKDSCNFYRAYYYGLNKTRDSLMHDNGPMAKIEYTVPVITPEQDTNEASTITNTSSNKKIVSKQYYDAEYYQFDITTTGWYNIDLLWKQKNGEQESTLMVRIRGEYNARIKIYLVIPSIKIFTEGGLLENSKDYGFDEANGKIPLPQNTDAYVIAVSEQNEKIYYTQQHFTTSTSQTIDISLKETDKQRMLTSFESLGLNDANLTVEKTKNFDGVKGVDTELQNLKEKLKHCACSEVSAKSAMADSSIKK